MPIRSKDGGAAPPNRSITEEWSNAVEATAERPVSDLPVFDEGRFEIIGERARGGVGRVFEATDRVLGRRIAIKELQHDQRGSTIRFLHETLVTARLQHPAIVPVYDAGIRASGDLCYAMRLVPGAT